MIRVLCAFAVLGLTAFAIALEIRRHQRSQILDDRRRSPRYPLDPTDEAGA